MSDRRNDEAPNTRRGRWVPWIALALALAGAAGVSVYSAIIGARSQLGALAAVVDGRSQLVRAAEPEPMAAPMAAARIVEPEPIPIPSTEPQRQPPAAPVPLDDEHQPAEQAVQRFAGHEAAFRARLETLLAADPETLEGVRALLDERDPAVLAENMRLLHDTFAVE